MANSDRIPSDPTLSTGGGGGYQRGKGGRSPRRGSGDGGGRSLGMNFMVALLIAGLVIAGWFIANQHQMLVAEQAERDFADVVQQHANNVRSFVVTESTVLDVYQQLDAADSAAGDVVCLPGWQQVVGKATSKR